MHKDEKIPSSGAPASEDPLTAMVNAGVNAAVAGGGKSRQLSLLNHYESVANLYQANFECIAPIKLRL